MSQKNHLVTPVGRLVQGSLYEPQTTDAENKPLTVRNGVNVGQPRVEYYFAVAIAKGQESHWRETKWGAIIWAAGQAGFPGGQANSPSFAWKITDGDSQIPNTKGKKPCDREGYPGHWVLNFTSGFAPQITADGGSRYLLDKDAVSLGDYIQVAGTVTDNESPMKPGVFLNHSHVCFNGYGQKIIVGIDPKNIGFEEAMDSRASAVPVASMQQPAPVNTSAPVMPHPGILTPPPSAPVAAPKKVMLPAANGHSYESYIAMGWTDVQLIQNGLMAP